MIVPSRDEFVRLAEDHDVVPVAREVYADLTTPISAFMSLAQGAEHAFLLESVTGGERLGRYSFLGVGDREVVTAHGADVVVENGGVTGERAADPLEVVKRRLAAGRMARVPGLPLFVGGVVGYVGYESATGFERVPRHGTDELGVPDLAFMFADIVVAFDHARRVMQVIAPVRPGGAPELAYDRALGRIDAYLRRIDAGPAGAELGAVGVRAEVPLEPHTSREDFLGQVERAKQHILAGDIFQVVLSQRFSAPYAGDGLDLYRVLRAVNPSPYMFYVRTRDVTLVGSSPEPLVRVEGDEVLTRPLAGTRPRGVDAGEDGRLRAELLADEKERAEHVMLVDLGRNDLGRVCVPGTVRVDELMEVEYYSHVMHIVSNVTGTLAPGKDAFDALRAAFPAGTVSGAPKVRAMEIIRDLEPAARGPYAGTVGYLGLDGAMDMCITIRTFMLVNGRAYLQSGAGIVADSDAEREYEECLHKARALHHALELAEGMRLGESSGAGITGGAGVILVVDNYDSFTYNLVQLLAALGGEIEVRRNDAIDAREAIALAPRGIVISPGPGTPQDAGISRDVIRAAADAGIPLLGVCLGHQCIAEVYGGRVCRAPQPVHGKTDEILHDGAALFAGIASPFTATRYHSLCVDAASVPDELEVQARTADGVVMALRHRTRPVFGVQFHPESVLTPEGTKLLANFLDVAGEVPLERETSGTPASISAAGGAARASAGLAEVTGVTGAIARVTAGGSLSEREAELVMGIVMDGEATPAQISALVVGMRMKGETVDEIVGFARAMRARAMAVHPTVGRYIDTCGTGGDGLHTFNISTTTAFVVAGAGVQVAKHGNRAVSSSAGSADVLEALGVSLDLEPVDMARCIDECGVGFLFAPTLHASMRHAGAPRREIGVRTVFNILGPLTNPAGARRQLLGVYDPRLAPVMAEVAGRLGAERVLVVHGHPGMDEVSASGTTVVAEFDAERADEGTRTYEVTPEQVGIARGTVADIAGGDAAENAALVRAVLAGEGGARRDVVLMNAAAALLAAGTVADLAEGVARARESIDSGRAATVLDSLVAVSTRLAAEAAGRSGETS